MSGLARSENRRRRRIWRKATHLLYGRRGAPAGIDYLYKELKGMLEALESHESSQRLKKWERRENDQWLYRRIYQDYEDIESLSRQIERFFETRRR